LKNTLLCFVLLLQGSWLPACSDAVAGEPMLEAPDAYTLVGGKSFRDGYPALDAAGGVNVVVEIPAGSTQKWEVDKSDGSLRWELEKGEPRVIRYLGYPGNYGMIPRTLLPKARGGDGDPLDVLVLGPALPRGAVVKARVVGVLKLLDGGERDDKLIAVSTTGAFSEVRDLDSLRASFAGVTEIVELWFANYKGPGRTESKGYGDVSAALEILREASDYFEKSL
jgi:inorganic pyrophosphatase